MVKFSFKALVRKTKAQGPTVVLLLEFKQSSGHERLRFLPKLSLLAKPNTVHQKKE